MTEGSVFTEVHTIGMSLEMSQELKPGGEVMLMARVEAARAMRGRRVFANILMLHK